MARSDHERLVAALLRMRPHIRQSEDRAWSRSVAVRVIDCVLSLNRNYDRFVVPRLDRFERERPHVRSVLDLYREMKKHRSADVFVQRVLDYNHKGRADTLAGVARMAREISGEGSDIDQLANLERWAQSASFNDYKATPIRGFGLAGFQYLRMLLGANTAKPDIKITRWVADAVGHSVSPARALELMELAAHEAGVCLRDADTTIWETSTRDQPQQRPHPLPRRAPGCPSG